MDLSECPSTHRKSFFAFQHATLKCWCSLPTNASQAGLCRIGLFVPWWLFLGYSALVKCAVLSSSISVAQQRNKGKVYNHQGHGSRDCVVFLCACAWRPACRSGDVNMLLKGTELASESNQADMQITHKTVKWRVLRWSPVSDIHLLAACPRARRSFRFSSCLTENTHFFSRN